MVSPYYSEEKRSANTFVHARAKIYRKFGNGIRVFVPSKNSYMYHFEGIEVHKGTDKTYKFLLSKFDPDVVAIHSPRYTLGMNTMKMLDMTCVPIIMWIHGTEALINAFHNYFPPWQLMEKTKNILGGTLKIAVLRLLISRASAVVYVSNWMKRTAERYLLFKHPHSFVIPNPVDTDLFFYPEREHEIRSKGVSVRGLSWKYGIDIAIRAYSKIKLTNLTVIGTGRLEVYMHNLAERLQSNVSFMSKHIDHNKMPELYAKFGYFVAPSRTEAQGLAMCEAMASGLPIIATRVGGIPEFVQDKINGLLVPPENPYALRNAVGEILADPEIYGVLSKNAADSARKNLSHKKIYEKEYRVFKICIQLYDSKTSLS
jgi:glycosyltransferase involved in cell wall biosynthesis